MTDLQRKLLAAFDSECRGIVECVRSHLLALERADGGPGAASAASMEEAFRMAHTLKGAARVVDLHGVVALAHKLETVFALIREGRIEPDSRTIAGIHSALDAVEDAVVAFKDPTPSIVAGAESSSLKAHREIDGLINAFESSPQAPLKSADEAPAGREHDPIESVRLSADHLDRLLHTAGDLLASTHGQERLTVELDAMERQSSAVEREWDILRQLAGRPLQKLVEIPEFRRVAAYIDFIEQEIQSLSKQLRRSARASRQASRTQGLLGTRLQEEIQKARMVPSGSVLEGFHKMVRDLAREESKEVELRASGMGVEADRLVLQALRSPLMHMLRNCVSHGIEPAAERSAAGKSPAGRITLELETVGGRLRIALSDDGRGLDIRRIGEVAIRAGLLSAEEAAKRSREGLAQLIFHPGFSTAPKLTAVSGRGMGLSVVHETVKRLQGTVQVGADAGRGARFTLTVPLTFSNHRLLLVTCRGKTLAIPHYGIDHLRRVKVSALRTIGGKSSVVLDDKPVPLLALASLLGQADHKVQPNGDAVSVVVLKAGTGLLAIAVDAVLGERDAVIKELASPLRKLKHLLGAIHRGDGSVSLVLDPSELIRANLGDAPLVVQEPVLDAARESGPRLRILVVDDSITTRTLEKGLLEASGYEVGLAVDGAEALLKLRSQRYDLVISDVEMPRMDGFALLGEMKKDPASAAIPVIMVTSRESESDRQRGMSLGADAYILKQRFDQAVLLEAIRRVV